MVNRRRFIDCYKRDILKLPNYKFSEAIKAENIVAHNENAMTDAYMFRNDRRMNSHISSELVIWFSGGPDYEISTAQRYLATSEEDYMDGVVFSVFNAYATLRVGGTTISATLEKTFREFVIMAACLCPHSF